MRRILILSAFLLLVSLASALDAENEADGDNEEDYISLAGDTKVNDYWQEPERFDNYSDEWESYEEGDNQEPQPDPNGHSEEGEEEEEDSEEDPPKPEDHASILPVVSTTVAPTASSNVSELVQELKGLERYSTASPKNGGIEFRDPDYYQPDPEEPFYDEQSPIVEVEIEISRGPVEQKESEVSINWPAEAHADSQNIKPENTDSKQEAVTDNSEDPGLLDGDQLTKVINEWRNLEYSERLQKIKR